MKKEYLIIGTFMLIFLSACCSDTDRGINIFERGTVTNNGVDHTDFCSNETTLVEFYCVNSTYSNITYNCKYGCLNGTCVNMTYPNCTDSDGGINFMEQGRVDYNFYYYIDYCFYEKSLKEYYCKNDTAVDYVVVNCTQQCTDGVFLNVTGNFSV